MLLEKDHQGLDLCRDATNVQFVIKKKKILVKSNKTRSVCTVVKLYCCTPENFNDNNQKKRFRDDQGKLEFEKDLGHIYLIQVLTVTE